MKQSQLRRLIREVIAEQRVPHSSGPASHTMGIGSSSGTSLPSQAEACQAMDMMIRGGGRGATRSKFWNWLTGIFKCKNPNHNHGGNEIDYMGDDVSIDGAV